MFTIRLWKRCMHNRNTIIPIYHKMPKYVDRIREIYKRYAIDIADPVSRTRVI